MAAALLLGSLPFIGYIPAANVPAAAALVALLASLRWPRVAIVGGQAVIGLVALFVVASILDPGPQ